MNDKWGNDQFHKWCVKKNIQLQKYYSKVLNGNACQDVLEALDGLELIKSGSVNLLDYVELLRAFDKVRKSCIGMELLESFEEDISAYKVVRHNFWQISKFLKDSTAFVYGCQTL